MTTRPNVLVICGEPVGSTMSGLGIRCVELARALRDVADVRLAAARPSPSSIEGIPVVTFEPHAPRALKPLIGDADVVIAQPQWPVVGTWLERSKAIVIVDLYTPETLETLEASQGEPLRRRTLLIDATLDRLEDALRIGDRFICASERQRDFWLGAMVAQRAFSAAEHDADPTLRDVIEVVPFGLPDAPPPPCSEKPIRCRFPEIAPADDVILWNGGLWPWLDAETAVQAVGMLSQRRTGTRLVFMGAANGPLSEESSAAARRAATSLGLLGTVVFFNDAWVPYDQRASWLLEADCALSLHHDHLESRFAFRTRMLDCLWTGLPIVCSPGDVFADLVTARSLGQVAAATSPEAVAASLERVLNAGRSSFAGALGSAADEFRWSQAVRPLARWIVCPPLPRERPRRPVFGRRSRSIAYRALRGMLARRQRSAPGDR